MILPVSLQVLDAGDGGGGISSLSVFSLLDEVLPPKLAENLESFSKILSKRYSLLLAFKRSERLIDNTSCENCQDIAVFHHNNFNKSMFN